MKGTRKNIKASKSRKIQAKVNTQLKQEKNQDGVVKNDSGITVDEKIIERNKYVLEHVNMWIVNADNKINIAFAMLSALVAAIVFISGNLLSDMPISQNARTCLLDYFYFASVVAGGCFCLSIFFYVLSVIPRMTSDKSIKNKFETNKEKKAKYSIFYDEIKDFEKAEYYVESAKAANLERFNEEILKEIYYNSGICSKKMYWFRWGGIASFATIALSMIAALLYFLYAVGV